jgi:sodium-dependent dicarboxylate transporter 2/3/5
MTAGAPPRRRTLLTGLAIAAAAAVYWYARTRIDEMAARSLAIFVLAAAFWIAEILPLFATALLTVVLQIVVLASDGGLADELSRLQGASSATPGLSPIPARAFIEPFASDIVMLFLGGLLLAAAVSRHGVDVVLAGRLLRPFAASPRRLLYGLAGLSAFFIMWMSNTATTAMMIALAWPLLNPMPAGERFRSAVLLAIAFGANIGGIGTPIGTPPNAIAFGALNRAGYEVTFLRWMLIAVPLEIILLTVIGVLLHAMFRPSPGLPLTPPVSQGRLSAQGIFTLIVLGAAITLWVTGGQHGLTPGTVALAAATALVAGGALEGRDVQAIDWKILILMWGALSLGTGVERSGLADSLAQADLSALPGGAWSAGAAMALTAVTVSTFMSNTAAAALLVPMALALALNTKLGVRRLIVRRPPCPMSSESRRNGLRASSSGFWNSWFRSFTLTRSRP